LYERIFEWNIFHLLLKIHIISPIYHFFVNHYWIKKKISKCVDFARFCVSSWKFLIKFWIIPKFATILSFFWYYKTQLCFVWHAHYTPFTCGKRILKNILNCKIFKILHLLNCECSLNVGNRLVSSNLFYHQYYFTKIVFI